MKGSYLGCAFSNSEIVKYLEKIKANYETIEDKYLFPLVAKYIDEEKL